MSNITEAKPQGIVAKEYLEKYGWMPSLTLAKLMVKERPDLFRTAHNARTTLMYYRGSAGAVHRKNLRDESHIRPHGTQADRAEPKLPAPIDDLFRWEVKKVEFDCALVLCDIHLPYHDLTSLQAAIDYGKKRGVDCIILNGDTLDCYSASDFCKDPNFWDSAQEQTQGVQFLEYLREKFPKTQIIFKEGNHEERLWRYAAVKTPSLCNCVQIDGKTPMVGLAGFLPFERLGVALVDNKQPIQVCDKLYILHGHEFPTPMTSPVNPARGLFMQAKANACAGHLHQTSAHTEAGLGAPISCFSFGALCHMRPRYRPLNKWNTGFGVIETNRGNWSVENKKIINGSIV